MSSKAGKRLVPELRFPEFRDAGGWSKVVLGEAISLEYGNPLPESSRVGGSFPVIGSNGVVGFHDVAITKGPAIVIGRKGSAGQVNWIDSDCFPIDTTFFVKNLAPEDFLMRFLFVLLESCNLEKLKDNGAVPGINRNSVYALRPFSPNPPEQQKIADCLSSLDDLIAAQAKKIEALKAHKKGLMQQLFPAEGETVPRLRFPEFRGAGAWEEKKAEKLFANRAEKGSAGLPIYSVTINEGMIKRSSLDRNFDDIAEPEGNKKAQRHDIAYNMMRMWQGASGVAVEDCMISPAYVVLAPRKEVNSVFFGYLFKLPQYLQKLTSHSRGLTLDRLRLYYKDFAEIPLLYPSMQEQKRIANCLSSIDQLIVVHVEKFETLKAQKQSLMQGLFPSVSEAEG